MLNKLRHSPRLSFGEFKRIYHLIYEDKPEPHPVWEPMQKDIQSTHLYQALQELKFKNYDELYRWSVSHIDAFWEFVIRTLKIRFKRPYTTIATHTSQLENIDWLTGAKLNIVDSCFNAPCEKIAIIYQKDDNSIQRMTYGELEILVNSIANAIAATFKIGDAIAINMPMTVESVAIYLAIIKAGCVVVSIADSFAADEIAVRLKISLAKGIFTQDYYWRNQKKICVYDKVKSANAPFAIIFTQDNHTVLRAGDVSFHTFAHGAAPRGAQLRFTSVSCNPNDYTNILFSSGTTGEPKAIPWTHTTPIKAAMDAYFHQDVHPHDCVAWPTNLGWMMGPWLVYACFINQATMALTHHVSTTLEFGQFIQDANVTILGLVPSIVNNWVANKTMEPFDWSKIKCFSSSGECSNPEDYLYLSWLGNGKPIIEYCGGTEIGGGYISSTLLHPNTPSTFTTPTLGIDFVLLSETHEINDRTGEVAISTPSIGLSQTLLNRNHHDVYFEGMPMHQGQLLRRHGDKIEKLSTHCYRSLGRVDDTMNLGGIKTSSAEIERVLNTLECIQETAAIAIQPKQGGPSQLIIYAVLRNQIETSQLKALFQAKISEKLNPLFKIHEVVIVPQLPRTASNKIMRRVLRDEY